MNYDKLSRLHAMSPEHVSPLLTEVIESFSLNLNSPDSINQPLMCSSASSTSEKKKRNEIKQQILGLC